MSYDIVIGDLGPTMPIGLTDGGGPVVLNVMTDVVTLHYYGSDKINRSVVLTIMNAPTGACEAAWIAGDLPVVGVYRGLATVTRTGDPTYPRTYPSGGSKILWWVNEKIG